MKVTWARAAVDTAVSVTLIPILGLLIAQALCAFLSDKTPWRDCRIFPAIPFTVHSDDAEVRRKARTSSAVSRAFGSPIAISYKNLLQDARYAEGVRAALNALGSAILALVGLGMVAILVYFTVLTPNDPGLTPRDVRDVGQAAGILGAVVLFLLRLRRGFGGWDRDLSDLTAITLCLDLLSHCWGIARGEEKLLDVEYYCSRLCARLGDFASSSNAFSDPERREAVLNHVALVQKELTLHSGRVLSGGAADLPGMVKVTGLLLERLLEQRWLGLLDLPDSGEIESTVRSSAETDPPRDGFIVICGSIAAALMMGASAAAGLPVAGMMPGALMLLLGPAMFWGRNRLGVSPRIVLDSIRNSVIGEGRQGGEQQTGSSEGNEST
ncbi:hypothetical protein RKD20_004565 [Streptomyces sp. SLBN-8D4]